MEYKDTGLFYDLEVSQDIVGGYGKLHDFRVARVIRPQTLMCYAYKWQDEKKIHFVSIHDFKTYKEFAQSLSDLLSRAPYAIAHNGVGFDDKMSNTFFIKEGVDIPKPRRSVDTLKVARAKLKLPSYSLNYLAEYFGIGSKEKITYVDVEDEFLSDNPSRKCIKLMEKYNKKDIVLLEGIYNKLLPLMNNHPNVAVIRNLSFACTNCGSTNVQSRGVKHTNAGSYAQYFCNECRSWPSDRSMIKQEDKVQLRSS